MSKFKREDPIGVPTRELRRLTHSSAVPTTYSSRDAEADVLKVRHAQAMDRGYEEGFAEGLARAAREAELARSAASQRIEAALAGLGNAVIEMRDAGLHLRSDIQKSAPRLAFALLEQLLGRELELAANPGREAILRTLAHDSGTLPATIRLNPTDVETLGEIADLGLGREVFIIADPHVLSGGALVEIGSTTLDGQIDTALERVKKILCEPTAEELGYDQAV